MGTQEELESQPKPDTFSVADSPACYRHTGEVRSDDGTLYELFDPYPVARSGWGRHMQHGGPVAGLLTRAAERIEPASPMQLSRVAIDILGPVPMAPVRVTARTLRPGKRIELVESSMQAQQATSGVWQDVAVARTWRLAVSDSRDAEFVSDNELELPGETAPGIDSIGLSDAWADSFVSALDWRIASEAYKPGVPTVAWLSLKIPLIEREELTPAVNVATISDIANGIGARLDTQHWTYMNTDLTLHLFRPPNLGWVGLESEMSIGPAGAGMTATTIHSEAGPIGRLAQSVLAQRLGSGNK